jgi:hypothetical protein
MRGPSKCLPLSETQSWLAATALLHVPLHVCPLISSFQQHELIASHAELASPDSEHAHPHPRSFYTQYIYQTTCINW